MTKLMLMLMLGAGPLTFEKLPEPVKAAVHKALPTATVISVEREQTKDKLVFEVKLKQAGQVIELSLSADGTVVSEERVVKLADAPGYVRKAVSEALPATAKIEQVEQVTEGGVTTFEVTARKADGKRVELTIQSDGSTRTEPATE